MDQVPFERVERIKRLLTDEDVLRGLVAVFSKARSDDLLLVYTKDLPAARVPASRRITLDDLEGENLLLYNGPTVGFAAIDLIRWDVPTKGPEFYRLSRYLRHLGMVEVLRTSWAELASYLSEHLEEISARSPDGALRRRVTAEIASAAAPRRIAGLPAAQRRGMVAFFPGRNHAVRLDESPLEAMAALRSSPEEDVIALEEVRPLLEAPGHRDRYPVELRTVLWRSGLHDELAGTLHELALAFHRRWERGGAAGDRKLAYALALEIHLAGGDVDDLSAVLPCEDFEKFLREGTGTYVYRRALEGQGDRSPAGVRRLSLEEAHDELAEWTGLSFSLLPLRALLELGAAAEHWCDLGPVLRKLRRTEILARNGWLLAQDFLESSRERRARFRVSSESLLETVAHCCAILSLTDPWRARQGRRNRWLFDAYRTLQRVVALLVRTTDGPRHSYYKALGYWYGCALEQGDGIADALDRMVTALRSTPRSPHDDDRDAELIERAERLERVGAALLDVLSGGGRAEAYLEVLGDLIKPTQDSVPQVIGRAADMARPIEVLSDPFRTSFQRYADIVDAVRTTRVNQIPVQDKIDRLRRHAGELKQARRLVFAHYHQARILDCLYQRAIADTEAVANRLQGGASLEVELVTRAIAAHLDDSGIVIQVTNVGRVEAFGVEVELLASKDFELLDQSFKQTRTRLGPDDSSPFRFRVRSLTDHETFPVRCTVTHQGSQPRMFVFTVRVTSPDGGAFQRKPNPYVFGAPLQEHREFYGRQLELESLLSHLALRRPQNVLLRGARRTGKTSLLYMVRAVLTDLDGRSGVRSWFDIPRTWYEGLDSAVPVMLDLQAIEWPADTPTPTRFYQALLGRMREAGLRSERSDRLLDEPYMTGTQLVPALSAILRESGGRRPVVLVDEFDILDQIGEKSFYGHLRHVVSTVQGVTWIIASALGLYNQVRDYESPFFNVFKIIDLGRMEPDAARRLIRAPWRHDQHQAGAPERPHLEFMDDAVEAILEETDHYPYFIQLLCSEIVDHVNTSRTNYVQHRTVYEVIEQRIVAEGSAGYEHFAYLWDRAGGLGKLILVALLENPGAMSAEELAASVEGRLRKRGLSTAGLPREYDESLRRLTVVDAVRRSRGRAYAFGIPLFRRLLLQRDESEDLEEIACQALVEERAAEKRHD